MRRATAVWILALSLFGGLSLAHAQEENKQGSQENAKHESPEKSVHAYQIDFSVQELEDGKKINSRHYVVDVNSGDWNHTKIGTRVPIVTSQFPNSGPNSPVSQEFKYMDVGSSIECRLAEQGNDLALSVRSEFSNFTAPGEMHSAQPIVRQMNITGSTLTSAGKPTIIGVVDDPNSNREFRLEATVTKLR